MLRSSLRTGGLVWRQTAGRRPHGYLEASSHAILLNDNDDRRKKGSTYMDRLREEGALARGQTRSFHVTPRRENLVLGGLVVAGGALTLKYGLQYYNQWKAAKAAQGEAEGGAASTEGGGGFASSLFAKRFYEGGFEDKMTRREAALILGVRESATPQRIKEAHRRILMLNHPDTGGSTYLASKINEAKEALIKGK